MHGVLAAETTILLHLDAIRSILLVLLRKLNIRFTDIRPGFVDTALLNDGKNYPMLLHKEDVAHEIMEAINKKRHVRVIDWRWRFITALWRCVPRCIWRYLPLRVKDKKKR